jgi:flagellar biosynthetic protein FliR
MTMDDLSKYIPNFLFILLRAGIMIMLLPFFSTNNFPAQIKVGLAVAIALILAPVVDLKIAQQSLPLLVVHEIILGIAFGFAARFVFYAIEMAGQMISSAMGLSIANVFNPDIGQSTELAQFFGFVSVLLLLSMNAHHDLIYIFVKSYEWLPLGKISLSGIVPAVVSLGSMMFVIALKISAPVIMTMVISHIILGFIYKAAPQINIFFVAYPIYIAVGLLMLLVGTPVFINVLGNYLGGIRTEMTKIIAVAGS